MEIQTVSQLAKVAVDQSNKSEGPETEPGLADKFSHLMQLGTPAISQAANLITQAGVNEPLIKAANAVSHSSNTNAEAVSGVSHSPSPEAMLGGQMLMGKAIIEVDLAAKTAGSLSQSINKLVNMQ